VDGAAKRLFVDIGRTGEDASAFQGQLVMVPRAGLATAQGVYGGIVGQAQKEGAFISNALQQIRGARQFDKHFLQEIPGIHFISGDVEQEGEKGGRMLVVEMFEIDARHWFQGRRLGPRNLSSQSAPKLFSEFGNIEVRPGGRGVVTATACRSMNIRFCLPTLVSVILAGSESKEDAI
jgi:hypothetical protein